MKTTNLPVGSGRKPVESLEREKFVALVAETGATLCAEGAVMGQRDLYRVINDPTLCPHKVSFVRDGKTIEMVGEEDFEWATSVKVV